MDDLLKQNITSFLTHMASDGNKTAFHMDLTEFSEDLSADFNALRKPLVERFSDEGVGNNSEYASERNKGLPRVIYFPFARHSPLAELRHLTETFRPKDIWPCTVDQSWINKGVFERCEHDYSRSSCTDDTHGGGSFRGDRRVFVWQLLLGA